MKVVFIAFIHFLMMPSTRKENEGFLSYSFIKLIFVSFLIILFFDIIFGLLIILPLKYLSIFPAQKVFEINTINFFKITFILPIIEELVFRLPLKISKINVALSLGLFIFLLIFNLVNIYFSLSILVVTFFVIFFGLNNNKIFDWIEKTLTKRFYILFYSQALIFGFLHLTNFNLNIKYFYLFPLIIVSPVFTGCFLGFIRIKFNYGIYICIVVHILSNLLYWLSRG